MVAVCVLVRSFPSHLVGIASGGVAIAFGLSGLLWTTLAGSLFGFVEGADPAKTHLVEFLTLVLMATDVAGVAIFLSAPRMLALVEDDDNAEQEPYSGHAVEKGDEDVPRLTESICSLDCLCLMALYSVVSAQVIGMSSYLSSIPTAFPGVHPKVFSMVPFVANVGGRVLYALVVDTLTRCGGRPAITAGNIWINVLYVLCFFALGAVACTGEGPGWLICLMVALGYSAYGGSVCFASSFTKLSFFDGHVGVLIGLLFTVAALASTIFSMFFDVGNSQGSSGVQRVPSDFVAPWVAGGVAALVALPVTLLVAIRALHGKRDPEEMGGYLAVRSVQTGPERGP